MKLLGVWLLVVCSVASWAEESPKNSPVPSAAPVASPTPAVPPTTTAPEVHEFDPVPLGEVEGGESTASVELPEIPSAPAKVISLGARIDATYTGGGAIAQGFAIPSLRLTAYGEAGGAIDYRVSIAQTREYSTALLPQLIPSEAYIDLATNPVRNGERKVGTDIRLRMGMFAPLFNPWWTADLSDINLPDYHEVHKANFANRDIGAELAVRPFGESLVLGGGAFNGSGVTSLNTNNSKAFTGFIQWNFALSSLKIALGSGAFFMEQSTKGSINYKRNLITDFFVTFSLEQAKIFIMIDSFFSQYEDPNRTISPNGYAIASNMGLMGWLGAFARYEFATDSPQKGRITSFQLGPTATLSDFAKAYLIYQSIRLSGTDERSIFLRVRVSI